MTAKMHVWLCLNCRATMAASSWPKRCVRGCARAYVLREDAKGLPGMEKADKDRAAALAKAEADAMSATMREPKADISAKAGEMERNSPLFFGSGDNPGLF